MQPLNGVPRQNIDPELVREALSLKRPPHVRHGIDVLTTTDALTTEVLRWDPSGSQVRWSYRAPDPVVGQSVDLTAVRRQATVTVPAGHGLNLYARRLRVWTEWLLLDGTWARFYLGVFIVTDPGARADDGLRVTSQLHLADKSHLWDSKVLSEPLEVPVGTLPLTWVRERLTARFGETRFAITGTDTALAAPRTFEAGLSDLEVCSTVLEAAGNEPLYADELGRPASQNHAVLAGRAAEVTYGPRQGKVLDEATVAPLLPSIPNVVRFTGRQGATLGNIEGNGLRTVRNQSTGPASIDRRGTEVELRVEVDAENQTVLDAVAASDAQRYFAGGGLRWEGSVALNPRHSDRDVIALNQPRLALTGETWQVTDWTYPLQELTGAQAVLMRVVAERRVTL